jgi:hypothetical protein
MTSGDFLVAFVTTRNSLRHVKPLSASLQKTSKDIVSAYRQIEEVGASLNEVRGTLAPSFHIWYLEAQELARSIGEEVTMLRVVGRQTLRGNPLAESPEEY